MSFDRLLPCTLVLAAFAAATGCTDPAADKPKAIVSAPSPTPAAPPEPVGEQVHYAISSDSKIGFVGSKVTGRHDGGFEKFEGAITVVEGDPTRSKVEVTIDTTSLWTDTERLTGHLKSPDFFEVETYPTARFQSTMIVRDGAQYRVSGNLTMHGMTRTVSFPATIEIGEDGTVAAHAEFSIKRFDFGIEYKGMADDLIRDEVVIKLDLKGVSGGQA